MNNGAVKNVYSDINIQSNGSKGDRASSYCAPFVAQQSATGSLVKCYSIGNVVVKNIQNFGPFAGELNGSAHLCFYSNSTTLTVDGAAGTPTCTEGTATDLATLQSEDFIYNTLYWDTEIWKAVDGQNPTLKCFD